MTDRDSDRVNNNNTTNRSHQWQRKWDKRRTLKREKENEEEEELLTTKFEARRKKTKISQAHKQKRTSHTAHFWCCLCEWFWNLSNTQTSRVEVQNKNANFQNGFDSCFYLRFFCFILLYNPIREIMWSWNFIVILNLDEFKRKINKII